MKRWWGGVLCLVGIHNADDVEWIDLTDYAAVPHLEHGIIEHRCSRCGVLRG